MLKQRLLLGPLLILALLGVCWLDERVDRMPAPSLAGYFPPGSTLPPGTVLFVLMAAVGILAANELAGILRANGVQASRFVTPLVAIMGLVSFAAIPRDCPAPLAAGVVVTAAVLVLLLSLAYYARHKSVEGVVAAAGGTLFSFVYLGLMPAFLLEIRREHSVWLIVAIVLTTKACDIGAYFTGKAIGKRKLISWLSPGKTWEGLAGGVALSSAVGAGAATLSGWIGLDVSAAQGAVAGAVFGLLGQAGDLLASLLKRDAGMKDSSRAIPGFGGVLDVVDSPLLVAPAAYWLLAAFGVG